MACKRRNAGPLDPNYDPVEHMWEWHVMIYKILELEIQKCIEGKFNLFHYLLCVYIAFYKL